MACASSRERCGRKASGPGGEHDLQGDGALELQVLAMKDDAHASLAQDLQDSIGAKPPHLARSLGRRENGGNLIPLLQKFGVFGPGSVSPVCD